MHYGIRNVTLLLHLFTLICCFQSITFGQSVYMKHYTINDGLPSNHVYITHQDLKGYLWVATASGLSRFDGKRFENFDHSDGLIDNDVMLVANDAKNNIWVKSFSKKPAFSVIKNNKVYEYTNTELSSLVYTISLTDKYYSEKRKTLYVTGLKGLVCIKDGEISSIRNTSLTGDFPYFETSDGKIFSGDRRDIYEITDTAICLFQRLNLRQEYFRMYCKNDKLYVITGRTVRVYDYINGHFALNKVKKFPYRPKVLYVDQYGVWVIPIAQKGALLYKDVYLSDDPIALKIPGVVNTFTTDKEGGVWVSTTDNGLFYLPNPEIVSYTSQDGLSSSVVHVIEPLSENNFWVGYNLGIAELLSIKENKITAKNSVQIDDLYPDNNYMIQIINDEERDRLVFMSRGGTRVLKDGCLSHLFVDSLYGTRKSLSIINDSTIGIGGTKYLLYNIRSSGYDVFNADRVYAQEFDANGDLILGSVEGLYLLNLRHKTLKRVTGTETLKITCLKYVNPYLWVGTQNNGIYLMKDDSVISNYTKTSFVKLPSNTINTLSISGDEIWLGTNRGLLYGSYNYDRMKFSDVKIISHNDGLLSPDINDISLFDSTAFIASNRGLTILTGYSEKRLQYSLSDVVVKNLNNDSILKGDSIVLQYEREGFEVAFKAAAFKYIDEMYYQYRLKSFDNKWKTTTSNKVQYTNIPPGEYTFEITVHDKRGNQSKQSQITHIKVMPRFWQTLWFKLLLIITAFVVTVLLTHFYYRHKNKQRFKKDAQRKLMAKARMETLKAQIKPHFIFNSLNALHDYVYTNTSEDVANLLRGFAGLIRKGLHLADSNFTTVKEEVEFLTDYLELEKIKCDNCFSYNLSVDKDAKNVSIPALVTQPFIENAVVHGMRTAMKKSGEITISYDLVDNDIICRIVDNGVGIKKTLERKASNGHVSKGADISSKMISYFKTGLDVDIEITIEDLSDTASEKNGTSVTLVFKNMKTSVHNEDTNNR